MPIFSLLFGRPPINSLNINQRTGTGTTYAGRLLDESERWAVNGRGNSRLQLKRRSEEVKSEFGEEDRKRIKDF
jgi:hypothetical protein